MSTEIFGGKQSSVMIKAFRSKRVLVVGDIMLDQYTYGQVARISPEAPVPIIHKTGERFVLGGAANTANNLQALGAQVSLLGVIGNDEEGAAVCSLLREINISPEYLITSSRPTIVKHRFVSGAHQLLRMDKEDIRDIVEDEEAILFARISEFVKDVDLIVVSDYAKGCITKKIAQELVRLASVRGLVITVDTKPSHKNFYIGVSVITPNIAEGVAMTGETDAGKIGVQLVNDFQSDVLLTRGADGMSVFSRDGTQIHIQAKQEGVVDVTGAGDTVVAAVSLGLAIGLSLESAARVANVAAGIVVTKSGTAGVCLEELRSALEGVAHVFDVAKYEKIWGYEKWLENNEKYCCKILKLNKGYQCSLHFHAKKDETFLITKGHVRMEIDGQVKHMYSGNFVRIEPGMKHRFMGVEDSEIVEVSTHHEETDSHRIEKSRKADEWNVL